MSLPWERNDDATPPAPASTSPTPTVDPPVVVPSPIPPVTNVGGSIQDAVKDVFEQAKPQLQKEVIDFAKQAILAELAGQDVDYAHPTITVTTSQGKELQVADAKNRSFRTFLQGLGLDLMYALIAIIASLSGDEFFSKTGMVTLGVLVVKTLLQTVVAYVARMRVTPTIKTASGDDAKLLPTAATDQVPRGEIIKMAVPTIGSLPNGA